MSRKEFIDVRGLPCPQPVIRSRRAMESADEVEVWVSQRDQVGNVSRMAERSGWRVTVQEEKDYYRLLLRRTAVSSDEVKVAPEDLTCGVGTGPVEKGATVVIADMVMGRGDETLGRVLMKAFIGVLLEVERRPATLILYNRGVHLAVDDSPVLDVLKELSEAGVEILACGTCLDYFGMKERLSVGEISNMYDIAEAMLSADRLVVV